MTERRGSWLNYLALGAKITPIEWPLFYVIFPYLLYVLLPSPAADLFTTNAWRQVMLFIPVVQLPLLLTGKMAYVDIGWPWGLVLLAINGVSLGQGWWLRRYIVCFLMFVHGGRMCLGGAIGFGKRTNWTYIFKEDLPRYQFAAHRWIHDDGMPAAGWMLKAQLDTLQQALANSVVLAAPILI